MAGQPPIGQNFRWSIPKPPITGNDPEALLEKANAKKGRLKDELVFLVEKTLVYKLHFEGTKSQEAILAFSKDLGENYHGIVKAGANGVFKDPGGSSSLKGPMLAHPASQIRLDGDADMLI